MLFRTIYNVIIEISFPILWIIGLFSKKINLFTRGRSKTFKILKSKSLDSNKWVWFHVASLGEFEQAKPLIIAYKKHFPKDKILLTSVLSIEYPHSSHRVVQSIPILKNSS